MKDQKLNELLSSLHDELEKTEQVDPDTMSLVRDLDEEINRLLVCSRPPGGRELPEANHRCPGPCRDLNER